LVAANGSEGVQISQNPEPIAILLTDAVLQNRAAKPPITG
jgi:hypothetical protein